MFGVGVGGLHKYIINCCTTGVGTLQMDVLGGGGLHYKWLYYWGVGVGVGEGGAVL